MCFFKQEVYIGYSLEDLAKVRQALANGGIKYWYNVHDHSGQWSGAVPYEAVLAVWG